MSKKKPKNTSKRPAKRPVKQKSGKVAEGVVRRAPSAGGGKTSLKMTKRGRGRPKKGESPTTPEVVETIAEMSLQCYTRQEIANKVGLAKSTVTSIINNKLRPIWREHLWDHLNEDILKVEQIERAAHKRFRKTKDPADLAMAKWAIEHRAKIAGHFAPTKLDVKQHAEIRVAGKSPSEFDEETIQMILRGIQERRQYQAILAEREA